MNSIFEYPIDKQYIRRKRKKLVKELLLQEKLITKKIAILAGSTITQVKEMMELFLLSQGIKPIFYESGYDRYYEEVMFGEELKEFNPDIVYVHTSVRNIKMMPRATDSKEEVERKLGFEYDRFNQMWEKLSKEFGCIVVQNNFEYCGNRSLGNAEGTLCAGKNYFINRLNMMFVEFAQMNSFLLINDINYLAASIGLEHWHDNNLWYSYKCGMSSEGIIEVANSVSSIIKTVYGKAKKCIVLDLDNTLWGGVVGDDGIDGIKIGKETPVAEAYTAFQNYIKELSERGITLAIASKNDHDNAVTGLNHPEMVLKYEDFTNIKANWQEKTKSIQEIAKEINIGLDSIVFIDDNPVERQLVKEFLPDVSTPDVGDNILDYIKHIDKNRYFETTNVSTDDMKRNEYYKQNIRRKELEDTVTNYEEFLSSLEMQAEIELFKPVYLERITQLTNKTNQFNLTTKRYTKSEIEKIEKSKEYIGLYAKLKDKFGDNGLVSVVVGECKEEALHIDLWLMSCRVLKRGLEHAVFDELISQCRKRELKIIYGYYYPTAKNKMVEKHYESLGFTLIQKDNGETKWELEIEKAAKRKNTIIQKGVY